MQVLKKWSLVAFVAGAWAIALAAPATAGPDDSPCARTLSLVCLIAPAFPSLDHDIDLTKDPDPVTGQPAALEPTPPPPG